MLHFIPRKKTKCTHTPNINHDYLLMDRIGRKFSYLFVF